VKAAGGKRHGAFGWLISLAVILAAAYAAWLALRRAEERPSSEDAALDAEVVHMAPLVGGRIVELSVAENAQVAKGAPVFRLDPVPYQLAVQAAEAELDVARAALATQQRMVATQRAAAAVAAEQTRRAQTNLDLASRTSGRLRPLGGQGYVPQQQVDQAETAQRDAETSLRQARVQESAAQQAVDTTEGAAALVRARDVALAQARRALGNAEVRAPFTGRVVGLKIAEGEVVAPSQSIFTLINTEAWYAVANFREGELAQIAVGACATVYSMIDPTRPIRGTVQGIGWGVLDQDSITLPRNLPYVSRTLDWVRIAQRFPVRIRLEEPPESLTRMGASATVQIRHGAACE
jgi:membrane fusion protein, multidrug efflux system